MTAPTNDLPGVVINVSASQPNSSNISDTGVAYFAGLALAGPLGQAVACQSMGDFISTFGIRDTGSLLYDACDVAFREGAHTIYVGRDAGPTPVNDSVILKDASAANTLTISSNGPTSTGWSVAVVAGSAGGTYQIVVTDSSSNLVASSPNLTTVADAVAWATTTKVVIATVVGTLPPAVAAAAPMAGGSDNRTSIDMTSIPLRQAALTAMFPKMLGPGQIAYPGATNVGVHVALANVAQLTNRVALLDMPNTASATTLTALRTAFLVSTSLNGAAETFVAHCADWMYVPGVNGAPLRTVPPSSYWAGLIAASDANTSNPNIAVAGSRGIVNFAVGRTQPDWSDVDRNTLNVGHVNVALTVYGTIRIYGFRSGANPTSFASAVWLELTNVRMRMKIVSDLLAIGQQYIFSQLDGKGQTIAAFTGAITGQMLQYFLEGALYGDTADDAFTVVTGPPINTTATAALEQLNAQIGAKFSPYAEKVYFTLTKQAITEG